MHQENEHNILHQLLMGLGGARPQMSVYTSSKGWETTICEIGKGNWWDLPINKHNNQNLV